jgi:hypothetical protein
MLPSNLYELRVVYAAAGCWEQLKITHIHG